MSPTSTTPPLDPWTQLLSALGDGSDAVERAREALAREHSWSRSISALLAEIPEDRLVTQVRGAFFPEIQPSALLLLEHPEHGQLVLNHFDGPTFARFLSEGRVTPHYHHRSFAARILRGSYVQWLYHNTGALDRPELTQPIIVRCDRGDVYSIDHDRYHWVNQVEHDTISLMCRGPRIRAPLSHPPECITHDEVLRLRDRVLSLLARGDDQTGRVHGHFRSEPSPEVPCA